MKFNTREHAARFTEEVVLGCLQNKERFITHFCFRTVDMATLLECFPEHKEKLAEFILLNPDVLYFLFQNTTSIRHLLLDLLPDYKNKLFEKILSDPLFFNKIHSFNLKDLVEDFPEYSDTLFEKISSQKTIFFKWLNSNDQLSVAIDSFPRHKEKIYSVVLEDQKLLEEIIPYSTNLESLVKNLSPVKQRLLDKILEYKIHTKWTPPALILKRLMSLFPDCREKIIFEFFCNPDIFLQIENRDGWLPTLKEAIPEINNANTVREAKEILKSRAEIRRASRVIIGQVNRRKCQSLFGNLPVEIRLKIAGRVGSIKTEDASTAREFGGRCLTKI